jgi:Uncharacterized protein conserved in bacteria
MKVNGTLYAVASMPTARHHAASAVVNGKLYVIAGRVAGISPTVNVNANEMYDPEKNKWILLEPMPSKRSGIVAATAKKFTFDTISIYVFGGEEPSRPLIIMKGMISKLTNGSLKCLCLLHVMD